MKIVCVKKFRDKTTAKVIEKQKLVKVGDILECDDELANERIEKGFAKKYEPAEEVKAEEPAEKKSTKKK